MAENRKQRDRRKMLFARKLRKNMTDAEKILWEQLRNHRCAGLKFRRQAPISWFIADFVCNERRLIIEVDGSIHTKQKEYDQERDAELAALGYRVLRLTNIDVIYHLEESLARILHESKQQSPLST